MANNFPLQIKRLEFAPNPLESNNCGVQKEFSALKRCEFIPNQYMSLWFRTLSTKGLTMITKNFKSSIAVATLAGFGLLALSPLVNAQTVLGPLANTNGTVSHTTEFTGTGGDVLTFSQFDSTLGTLTGVSLTVNGTISSNISVSNTAATPSSGTVRTESIYSLVDPGSLLNLGPDLITASQSYSLDPGQSINIGPFTKSGSDTQSYTLQAILDEFTGVGSISLGLSSVTSTLLGNTGGNTSSNQVTTASASGTVTYTYTQSQGVPEAGTTAVLGLGSLAGAGTLMARRRRIRSGK